MYCPKCKGFGFYTTQNPDGTTNGHKCDHICNKHTKTLRQDKEEVSPFFRAHPA